MANKKNKQKHKNGKSAAESKKQNKNSWWKDTVQVVLCAILLAACLKMFIIDTRQIPTSSMEPTIQIGDRVLLWRLAYLGGAEPETGDIVVFRAPDELNEKHDLIKRVIGMPGDTLEVRSGVLYINGEVQDEDYIAESMAYEYGPVTVPEDSYFMMGDNRNHSLDSHAWSDPFVHEDDIKGKAVFRYWPLSDMGAM